MALNLDTPRIANTHRCQIWGRALLETTGQLLSNARTPGEVTRRKADYDAELVRYATRCRELRDAIQAANPDATDEAVEAAARDLIRAR